MNIVDRSDVKKYFKEGKIKLAIWLIIIGLILLFTKAVVCVILGIALIAIGVYLIVKSNSFEHEEKVDEITKLEVDAAKERAINKFNLIKEQVSLIEPISIYGPADQPNSPTAVALELTGKKLSRRLRKRLGANNDDPIYIEKLGSDSKYRYTLVGITTYLFGEDQLYVYYSNVDITTGLVFEEGTYEFFYKDIEATLSKQASTRVFNRKKKKFERIVKEWFEIRTTGSYYTGAFGARKPEDPSKIDEQFTAMRNLIRDKKNS